jgi:hypothetical protein
MSKNTKSMVWGGLLAIFLLWLWQRYQARKV